MWLHGAVGVWLKSMGALLSSRASPPDDDPRRKIMRDAVVVYLPDRREEDATALEDLLGRVCDASGLGALAYTDSEGADAAIYLYGPEARPLFDSLRPVLLTYPDAADARIVLATGYGASRQYIKFPLHDGAG